MKSIYLTLWVFILFQINLGAQKQADQRAVPGNMNNAPISKSDYESVKLQINKPILIDFQAGQIDKYTVPLLAGQFASIKIYQKSVGIGYFVFAPNDSLIRNDDLNALYQTEVITIDANKTGDYRIEVFWDYGRPQSGKYLIVWEKVESLGRTPAARAEQLMKCWYETDGPGAAVVVLKNNKVVFKSVKGLANLEYKIPVSGSSAFELASVSKQFTGFAIALLIGQAKISPEDDIRKYIPEIPDFGRKITISHLIYHTSGLRNWDEMTISSGFRADDIVTDDMIMKMVVNQKQLNFNPGDAFSYCNTGYNLLTMIVEKVTGQSFANWITENIFNPLGMMNTVVADNYHLVVPNKTYSYKANNLGFNVIPNNFSAPGSTSVYSSLEDLSKWVNNLETGLVGGKKVLEILKDHGSLNNGEKLNGGFGNFTGKHKGINKVEHLGLTLGYRTAIARYPDQNISIIYLSNDGNDATYSRAWQMADIFLEGVKNEPLKSNPFPDLNEWLVRTSPLHVKPGIDLKEFEGIYYADELNISYKLMEIDGILTIVMPRIDNIWFKMDKPDSFSSSMKDFTRKIDFQRDNDKKIKGFNLSGGGDKEFLFLKLR